MRSIKLCGTFLGILGLSLTIHWSRAQGKLDLGLEYLKKGEFEKATPLLEDALTTNFTRPSLAAYISVIIKTKSWKEGEQYLKRRLKKDEENSVWYYSAWGKMLSAEEKPKEARQKFETALKSVGNNITNYELLSDEFASLGNIELAIEALKKAREVGQNNNLFSLELASLYSKIDSSADMSRELIVYARQVNNISPLQGLLGDFLTDEKRRDAFSKVLLQEIQNNPNQKILSDLMIWQNIQRKDFYKAFIQERAIDKRFKFEGTRILDLAVMAMENKDYESAEEMFAYVQKAYPDGPSADYSKRMVASAQRLRLDEETPVNIEKVKALMKTYEELNNQLTDNKQKAELLRDMAHLNAYYLGNQALAIKQLNAVIETSKQNRQLLDQSKLELADIYVLNNQPWEAALLYSQVDHSQKDSQLGYEAKLKVAKLYYFKGDFALAQDLLNILKKATSREIANDANALSLLIMDNTGLDSSESAMKAYAHAEQLLFQHKELEALDSLNDMLVRYSDHSLTDEILLLKAKTYLELDSTTMAIENLEKLYAGYGYDILADDALFLMGSIQEGRRKNSDEAMRIYQELIEKFPGSVYVAEARKRLRKLRGDVVN